MRILIDIGHPAHVHYFRNFIRIMQGKGHEFLIIARDKEVSQQLLTEYKIPFVSRGKGKKSAIGKLFYIITADCLIIRLARKFKPDFFIGFASTYAAHAAKFLRKPCLIFDDTEHAKFELFLYRPFATFIFTPFCFNKDLGNKQIRFHAFMELCYLHSNYYAPNSNIYSLLGIEQTKKFVLLRFVSWNASHDIGQVGLDIETKRSLIEKLKSKYEVFISAEGNLPSEFEPYRIKIPVHRMHDVLAFAALFIGEGATMASECGLLGTPAIYVNSLKVGYLQEQEKRGLIAGFSNSKGVIEKMEEWLANDTLHAEMKARRNKMLEEMIDPTKMLVWFVENYPESARIMKEDSEFQKLFK